MGTNCCVLCVPQANLANFINNDITNSPVDTAEKRREREERMQKKNDKADAGEDDKDGLSVRRYLFKNYREQAKYDGTTDCALWEAAAATAAAPSFFDAMEITTQDPRGDGRKETFVDGGV
eukprot:COSAG06_NODE_24434_length_663_cov_0.625887_1_plen_120_part_10